MSFADLVGEVPAWNPLEDLILGLLRPLEEHVPRLKVGTWIPNNTRMPFMLVRRDGHAFSSDSFSPNKDPRFTRRGAFSVETFTQDPDGDYRAGLLQDIAFRRLFTALRKQDIVPGCGYLTDIATLAPPRRASDWATGTGVVQYANLPKNLHRWEAVYGIGHRPDLGNQPDQLALLQ